MQLLEDFPHTRREQYLMAIPDGLLTSAEAATRSLVEIRYRRYLRSLLPLVEEAALRGLSVREWAAEFIATFEGDLPAVFRR